MKLITCEYFNCGKAVEASAKNCVIIKFRKCYFCEEHIKRYAPWRE